MIVEIISIVVLVILWLWISTDIMVERKKKRSFKWCVVFTLIVIIAQLGCLLTDNTVPDNRWLSILFNAIGFSVSPFVLIMESNFYGTVPSKKQMLYLIPAIVNALLVVTSPLHHLIFVVTENCSYHRGKGFFLYLLVFVYSVVLSFVKKLYALQYYPTYFKKKIIVSSIFMLFGIMNQVLFPQYRTTWIIIAVYLVLYYALFFEMNSVLDGLTGLLNKSVFSRQLERLKRLPNQTTVLFMMDVNHFKQVNDIHGHVYGDVCLQEVAKILKEVFVRRAQVFRFGGDEYCAIVSLKADEKVDRYKAKFEALIQRKQAEDPDFPGAAIGCAVFHPDMSVYDLIEQADREMYRDKREKEHIEN